MANYHPADELLMQFAAGQLTNALGIQTACHLESCQQCQHKVRLYEQLGGDLIDISTPTEVDSGAKSRLLTNLHKLRADSAETSATSSNAATGNTATDNTFANNTGAIEDLDELYKKQLSGANQRLPRPLRRFLPDYYENLPWSGFSKSIQSYDLPFSDDQYTARFYKIAAGSELPQHTHRGNEFTLVMSGSFSDLSGDYNPGDFVLADSSTHHQPRAHEKEDCICFAVTDAPLKMTGFFGRMLNPFLK
ncbi:MAG: putative transcriptional regulator [Oleispira sp.]|jgi:putative transcriptional regulator